QFPQYEAAARGFAVQANGAFWEVELTDGKSIDPLVDLLRGRGLSIRHLMEKRQTLEDLFMETVVAAEPGVDIPRARRLTG
ncbi:MAG TPA: ABC transporter ATP-binding protein, partial [Gemmataceae bacterium]|nr:ABC transporter ATP-binding protein [Gemmataceae bacterium]